MRRFPGIFIVPAWMARPPRAQPSFVAGKIIVQ
jgi:hypothetical protein